MANVHSIIENEIPVIEEDVSAWKYGFPEC